LSGGHPTAYGLIAVLAAILAGFTIDALTVRLRRRSWGKPRPKIRGHADFPEPTNPGEAQADHEPEREPAHHI